VVALFNDDVPVTGNEILHFFFPNKAVDHRYIQSAVWLGLAAANLPHIFLVNAENIASCATYWQRRGWNAPVSCDWRVRAASN